MKFDDVFLFNLSPTSVGLAFFLVAVTTLLIKRNSRRSAGQFHKGRPLPPFAPAGYRETVIELWGKDAPWFFLKNAREVGSFYQLRAWSNTTAVICEHEVARRILDDSRGSKPLWAYDFADLAAGGDNFFSAEGHRWKHARKAVAPAFAPAHNEGVKVVCESVLKEWIEDVLEPTVAKDKPFDVHHEMQRISIRVVAEAGFEYKMTDEEVETVIKSFDDIYISQKKLINPLRLWFGWFYTDVRRAKQATTDLLSLSGRILKAYRERGNAVHGSIISFIDGNDEYNSDDERTRDMLVFLQAGYDSTAATLSWTLLELARNSREQALLREDLRTKHRLECPAPRLKRVIRESFRLNPVAAFGPIRTVPADIDAGPFVIPEGSDAIMPLFAIHRCSEVFKDPDSFQSDRWIDPDDAMKSSVMPYGLGRRNCVGQSMANIEIDVVLGHLCAGFEFTVVDEGMHDHFVILKPLGTLLSVKRADSSVHHP